jgi:hypothetical protein
VTWLGRGRGGAVVGPARGRVIGPACAREAVLAAPFCLSLSLSLSLSVVLTRRLSPFPVVQGRCCFGGGARVAGGGLVCPCGVLNVLHCLKHGDVCENAVHKGNLVDNLGSGWECDPIRRQRQLPESRDQCCLWKIWEAPGRRMSPSRSWN